MRVVMAAVCFLIVVIVVVLAVKSVYLFQTHTPGQILFSSDWNPQKGGFGLMPFIVGSLYVTAIAMLIAVPISILSAVYIAEYFPANIRQLTKSFVDVLAGIPSVVYGMCAIVVLVPFVRDVVAPLVGVSTTGFCVLSAALVLAVMVFPIIISICVDVFAAVPFEAREVAFAVGATKWQTTKLVVGRAAAGGVFSAVLLGFGRAFGETIAVAMLVGNLPRIPATVFDSGATLPSIIASTYGEMMSIPLYDAAMMFLALVLIIVVLVFNYFANLIKARVVRAQSGVEA